MLDEMDDTKKRFLGLIYFGIFGISLYWGLHYTAQDYMHFDTIQPYSLPFLIPAYVLCGINLFLGVKCFRF